VDAEDAARLTDYSDRYRPGARRFDVGQRSNFTLVPLAIAALRQLGEWGVGNISGFGHAPTFTAPLAGRPAPDTASTMGRSISGHGSRAARQVWRRFQEAIP
jgi:hypothetical protein